MELQVKDLNNQVISNIDVAETLFNRTYNEALVHQVVVAYMAGARQGTKAQKTRAEVRGGGIKPWKQKGTGRARAGSIRSPLWRKGGVIFAAKPRQFDQKINKKMYKACIAVIFSELLRQNRLLIVNQLELTSPKTKELVKVMHNLELTDALIVVKEVTENLYLAVRNLYHTNVCDMVSLDPVSLITYEKVIMTEEALKTLEENLK